jgi:deoxyribonuclease-4
MVNALHEAEKLGFDTVQVFTKNQQQWKAPPLDAGVVRDWRAELARLAWQDRTVSHASYLINLASVNDDLFRKSVDLMTDEIERCEALGIPFLVHHPGSSVGWDRESGIARIGVAYAEIFRRTPGYRTVSCLEGTVGAGNTLGGPFEELAKLRAVIADVTGAPQRVGFCLDTCHMHAFGYDLSERAASEQVLRDFDRLCGMRNLRVMHINDSKGAVGSRLDRHAHIGAGTIGRAPRGERARLGASGFAAVMNHPHLRGVPKILETPKEATPSGTAWDEINLRRLTSLVGEPRERGGPPKAGASSARRSRGITR